MSHTLRCVFAAALLLPAVPLPARADCPGAACVPGGGSPKTDCVVEIEGVVPNAPASRPKKLRCQDGDPACDTDGALNGSCRVLVRLCLNVDDPALPLCAPSDVASLELRNPAPGRRGHDPQLAALADALPPLPTADAACTDAVPVYAPLRTKRGRFKASTRTLRSVAATSSGQRDADRVSVTCEPSPRFRGPRAGYALAKVVDGPAELVGGPLARGRLGDVLLANDRIQVVIQQPGRSMFGIGPFGGTLIDADLQRTAGEERDSFEEIAPLVNVEGTVNYTSLEVLDDGAAGGEAVVRATGPDDLLDYINPSSIVAALGLSFPASIDDQNLPLDVQTDYALAPGSNAVRMETTLRNTSVLALDLFFGDIVNGSGQVELFQERYGFGEPLVTPSCPESAWVECAAGTCDPCSYVAWSGDESAKGVSYGYVHQEDASSTFSVSGVTAVLLGNEVLAVLLGAGAPNFHLEAAGSPGDALTLTRWFVVGDGSVGAITDARNELRAIATGELSGEVTADEDGDGKPEPVAGADVAVTVEGGALTSIVTHFRTDAAGRYRGTLPPGAYAVRANVEGRLFPQPDVRLVEVAEAGRTEADFAFARPGRLEVRVTDEAGQPIPAKVSLVGFDPSPDPERFENIAGAVENVTHVFGDQGDSLGYGLANVFFADRTGSTGVVDVEPGPYQVVVSRGTRYSHFAQTIALSESGGEDALVVEASLARVVEMPGFVAADFHLHSIDSPDSEVSREARVASQLAEGIDFFTPSEHDIRVDFAPIVEALGVQDLVATAVSSEITSFDYGHFNSWPVTVDPAQVNGGAVDWGRPGVAPGEDFPSLGSYGLSPGELIAAALADPLPNLVQINHIDSFFGASGLAIDTGFEPPQSFASPESRRLDPSLTNLFDDGFQALEVWNGNQGVFLGENLGDWFNLLNQGIVRTAVATSDTHEKRSNSGGTRTFIASAVTDPAALWTEAGTLAGAVAAGRAVGSNGPFVACSLAAASTGETAGLGVGDPLLATTTDGAVDVTVEVSSPGWAEFDTIELYVNNATQPYDHDADPGTRDRYRAFPDVVLTAGTDFTLTEVPAVPGVPGSESWHATVTTQLAGLLVDSWVVAMVRGSNGVSRPLFPIVPGGLSAAANPTFESLLDGNLGEGGNRSLAFTNPLFVDVDGDDAWTPPGVQIAPL